MLSDHEAPLIESTIGPYRVLDRIGSGGMGEVFRAQDTRLGRDVALKVLNAELQTPETRERLLHEARAAATLNHPNVGSIYDVVEAEGRLCLVMEFVEGETLSGRLARGPLRCEELLPLVRQLLDGLAHAHTHGVIHRDLKPANLVVTPDGRLKILDFGIARIRTRARSAERHATSGAPEIAGSPGYAAPEHLLGKATGPRTDLYSVGVLMFQCLTGRLPFNAPDLITSLVAPLTDERPDFAKVCPGVSDDVIGIMERALRAEPAERFESADDMRRAVERAVAAQAERPTVTVDGATAPHWKPRRASRLRWTAVAVLIVALIGAAAVPLYRRWTAPVVVPGRTVLAVLPLENLSGDPSNAWLGAGIAETLGVSLSKLRSLTVISRSDVVDAVRRTQDSRSIARQVGATLLVAGSIQEWQNRLKVTVRLVNPDGRVSWSDSYEAPVDAIFALQADIAAALSNHLQLSDEGARLAEQPTTSREALTEYWKGQAALERATLVANTQSAIDSFTRAVTLDPNFALAHAALANAYWIQYGETREKALTTSAIDAAMKALSLDPDQPRVRISLAVIYAGTGQYQSADIELRRVLALEPNSDEAYRQLAKVLQAENRSGEALDALNRAIAIRPEYWRNHADLGVAHLRLGQLEEARQALERAIELQPDNPASHNNIGIVYAQLGDSDRALQEFERANALAPTRRGYTNLGMRYAEAGRLEDALKAYRTALTFDTQSEVTHGNIGDVLVQLGRLDEAKREYETARALSLKLLQVNDKDASTLARLAMFEAKLGRQAEALEHGEAALALAPRDPDVNYKMAVVHLKLQQTDLAMQKLAHALQYGASASLVRSDFDLAPLRARPDFQKLIAAPTQSGGGHR